jgi:hypothetical protein
VEEENWSGKHQNDNQEIYANEQKQAQLFFSFSFNIISCFFFHFFLLSIIVVVVDSSTDFSLVSPHNSRLLFKKKEKKIK